MTLWLPLAASLHLLLPLNELLTQVVEGPSPPKKYVGKSNSFINIAYEKGGLQIPIVHGLCSISAPPTQPPQQGEQFV